MKDEIWAKLGDKAYRESFSEGVVDDRLSAQIYYLRKHRGWTQKDLAERAGVSQPTVSGLEESASGARLETLRKIASAFDVVLDARFDSFSNAVRSFEKAPINTHVLSFTEDTSPEKMILNSAFSSAGPYRKTVAPSSGKSISIPRMAAERGVLLDA
jgi:transcriptional regulator with XRE-family HTH domain